MNGLTGYALSTLRSDAEFILYAGQDARGTGGDLPPILALAPAAEHPAPHTLARLTRAYGFREELDPAWAARPIALAQHRGRPLLVCERPDGEPLDRVVFPMETGAFLRVAIGIAWALGRLHDRGLIHKDVKPANLLVQPVTGRAWLTGFGIASRLARERQTAAPPEFIAGTLAYMAPEQTGRMNRSIDLRADLYSLGVTLYELLTGSLPFTATDSMEWVHCHIARQPIPPAERRSGVPGVLSALVMKLLAKAAEERYQTAAGVEADLRRCLEQWESSDRIDPFPLGTRDRSGRLLLPEILYGRERERQALLDAFERVARTGTSTLVLVSGYSGVGKSSVVNELQRAIVGSRGLFASGKFDQHKRDIPYATLAQAFRTLVRTILSASDGEVARWREELQAALGPNGQAIVNVIPELEWVVGPQPPMPEVPAADAERRFRLVFRSFLSVFARQAHPLVLFLDDLQWLDAATLDLVEDVATHADIRYLLLVGAFRENEVTAAHPLARTLEAIRRTATPVHEIVLAPLSFGDIAALVSDTLHCDGTLAAPLAQLVLQKTLGNPFFAIQFLTMLREEHLLDFDPHEAAWRWDLERIQARGFTANVVELMAGKLERLPAHTREMVTEMACLGSRAAVDVLATVRGTPESKVHADLWDALRLELIVRAGDSYAFVHDRVEEAAYALVPDARRVEAHLRIGRLLIAHMPPEQLEDGIFEIVNQVNRGAALVASREERERFARLNLIAGMRAKSAAAYASALNYLTIGEAFLAEDRWERNWRLALALALPRAECEYLTGDTAVARERLERLAERASDIVDRAAVTCVQLELHVGSDRADLGVECGLAFLAHAGIQWPAHPSDDDVTHEFERMWQLLRGRHIEELLELPVMTDPTWAAIVDVLTVLHSPANFTDGNLLALVIARMVNLSIEHGNSEGSSLGYVFLGMILRSRFGDGEAGFRFGKLGVDLAERAGLTRYRAHVYLNFGNAINPWTRHVRTSFALLRSALSAATRAGQPTYASYTYAQLVTAHLVAGEVLSDVEGLVEEGLAFARQAGFAIGADLMQGHLGLIRALRGLTPDLTSFAHANLDEAGFMERVAEDPALAMSACWYWVRKLQACVLAGGAAALDAAALDAAALQAVGVQAVTVQAVALDAASNAASVLWTSPGYLIVADYTFYAALAHAAWLTTASASAGERPALWETLKAHARQLETWSASCAENFENRAVLVSAEIARLHERDLDAMHLYERAIQLARDQGFVHIEALAHELAAGFYASRGFEKIARAYLRDARYAYLRWGAIAKVRQLDRDHPHLDGAGAAAGAASPSPSPSPGTMTIGSPIEQLDLATVIKVSQAISSEIVLEKLIDTLMRTAIEHAAAERGVLMLARGGDLQIEAEAVTRGDTVAVHRSPGAAVTLPQSIVHYVVRTRETVTFGDASVQAPLAADGDIQQRRVRSVLCLPLINQGRLMAVLYLENNLATHVFTPARVAVLTLLASQAAISLEIAHLYADVQASEERLRRDQGKIRRLVDSNIIGICIWNFAGQIVEANDALLRMLEYDRDEVVSGRVSWTGLTPPEWREADERALTDLQTLGIVQPFEKEFWRKDGTRVPVLIGCAVFEGAGDEGVAFVLDLTERKRAEAQLRDMAGRLITAQEEERRRIGRELHDHVSQQLALLALTIDQTIAIGPPAPAPTLALDAAPPPAPASAQALDVALRDIRQQTTDVIADVRGLSHRLHSTLIDQLGLIAAIERLSVESSSRYGLRIAFEPSLLSRPVPSDVALCLFRVAEEALSNVGKHSRATAARVEIREGNEGLEVSIEDDGAGFEPEAVEAMTGLGLVSMRERLRIAGGTLRVRSSPARGTRVNVWVPTDNKS